MDVYSYSMILYQLFEHHPPFVGLDPVEAARQAALYDKRPNLIQLSERKPFPFNVRSHLVNAVLNPWGCAGCRSLLRN